MTWNGEDGSWLTAKKTHNELQVRHFVVFFEVRIYLQYYLGDEHANLGMGWYCGNSQEPDDVFAKNFVVDGSSSAEFGAGCYFTQHQGYNLITKTQNCTPRKPDGGKKHATSTDSEKKNENSETQEENVSEHQNPPLILSWLLLGNVYPVINPIIIIICNSRKFR